MDVMMTLIISCSVFGELSQHCVSVVVVQHTLTVQIVSKYVLNICTGNLLEFCFHHF